PRRVVGSIDALYGDRRVVCSYGSFRAKRRLRLWLWHLAACATDANFAGSVWIARGKGSELKRGALARLDAEEARRLLADLVAIRDEGSRQPLRFEPEAGWLALDAAEAPTRNGEPRTTTELRDKVWKKTAREGEVPPDESLVQVFGLEDPFGFDSTDQVEEVPLIAWSRRVLTKLREHSEDL
ncbi:MAG TPA: hypothetical protein VLC09_20985, partial [Polyangiaceae bacterium]|nr:hypothetical protein [Polyangiaceae bacterium]